MDDKEKLALEAQQLEARKKQLEEQAGGGTGEEEENEPEMIFFEEEEEPEGGAAGGDSKKGKATEINHSARDIGRYRDIFDDMGEEEELDEDKVYNRTKQLAEENQRLRLLAGGRDVIDKDPQLVKYRGLLGQKNEELFVIAHAQKYMNGGDDKDTAIKKAETRLENLKKKEGWEEQVEDFAVGVKGDINSSIADRQQELAKKLEDSKKSLDLKPDSKVIDKATELASKTEKFIGFKLPEKQRGKLQKEAAEYLKSGKLQKDLKDPGVLNEIAFFLAHKKQWEQNVVSRNNGKKSLVDKMQKDVRVAQTKKPIPAASSGKKTGFSPGGFLGTT